MTWGKMDDKFHRNKKVRALRRLRGGMEALGVWTFWWSWCLDDPELSGLVPVDELEKTDRRAAGLLVEVGLWLKENDGYRFKDFHEYNPTKAQREAKKAYDRDHVSAKRNGNQGDVVTDSDTSREAVVTESCPARVPVPSRPVPVPSVSGARDDGSTTGARVRTAFAGFYEGTKAALWPASQAKPDEVRAIAAWVDQTAAREGAEPGAIIDRVMANFAADSFVKTLRSPWSHFRTNFANYWSEPATKTIAVANDNTPRAGRIVY
jgi:hypothetical protein